MSTSCSPLVSAPSCIVRLSMSVIPYDPPGLFIVSTVAAGLGNTRQLVVTGIADVYVPEIITVGRGVSSGFVIYVLKQAAMEESA